MKVAILGAGAIAYGNAALLCRDGHDVALWSPSGKRTATLAAGAPLLATGAVTGRFYPRISSSCADALSGAEVVVVAVPGYGHRRVLDVAAPFLRSDQVVVFSSHMSLAALIWPVCCASEARPRRSRRSARPSPPGGRPHPMR